MTGLFLEPGDATPLDPNERAALKQSWITHRRDLNEAEQENIVKGAAWARRSRSRKPAALLTVAFALSLHRHMFGEVWKWAGTYRQTAKNIGIEANRVPAELPQLFEDARYWVENATYPPFEIAVRLHHRLVAIHPFPNGNGRHARLMADLLAERLGEDPFTWGSGSLTDPSDLRTRYIAALRAADDHDIAPLIAFAQS